MISNSVRWKFLLASGGSLVVTAAALILYFLFAAQQTQEWVGKQTEDNLRQSAEQYISTMADEQSLLVQNFFNRSFDRAEMLSRSILFLKHNAEKNVLSGESLRLSVNQLIQQTVSDDEQILGIYVVFEPNALDAEDTHFVDAASFASNSKGRFAPYWARLADGSVELEVLLEEDIHDTSLDTHNLPTNEWYACPIRMQRSCVLNPYLDTVGDTELLMTSVTLPLMENGKVIGMLGLDFSLANIQQMIDQMDRRMFSKRGEALLVSQQGIIAGYDIEPNQAGMDVRDANVPYGDTLLAWLTRSEKQVSWINNGQTLQAIVPVPLTGNAKPWGLVLNVSRADVMARAIALDRALSSANTRNTQTVILVGSIITLLALALLWLLVVRLVAPIRLVAERLQDIANGEGDLTRRLVVESDDELGTLAEGFNQFVGKLQGIVRQISHSVEGARSGAGQASRISHRTSEGMRQQFVEVDQVASASAQLASTAQEVVDNASQAVSSAKEANMAAEQGKEVIVSTTQAMSSLVDEVSATVPIADRLAQNSDNIDSILVVIESIAEQTNLLALNAAIEAARAGEQGRGFAVVAGEVRTLAGRTQDSIIQIRQVIEQLKAGTEDVVAAIQKGNDKAQITANQVSQTVVVLEQIIAHISNIDGTSSLIADAASEQRSVADDLSRNVANIRDVSQSVSEDAELSAQVSQELETLMLDQQSLVQQFKVD